MTFEVEVPLRHDTVWPAFTDPEQTARAVPGLIVDAVHPVPPADGSDGVAGDVVAGRLKLRVGAGPSGAAITYRGTACIASADARKGTLDIALDAAQARGNGALAGYLRITLAPAGEAGERTLISVVPELELSGRALEFAREDWHAAVTALAAAWVSALTADLADLAELQDGGAEVAESEVAEFEPEAAEPESVESEVAPEAEPEAVAEPEPQAEPEAVAEPEPEPEVVPERSDKSPAPAAEIDGDAISADAITEDPLEPIWQGRYEKNRWLPLIAALTLFLLIKRRRRHRTDPSGADSSFRME